jgi:hypothetical protein
MLTQAAEIEPFAKFIEALGPWLGQVVLIGGWAHHCIVSIPGQEM